MAKNMTFEELRSKSLHLGCKHSLSAPGLRVGDVHTSLSVRFLFCAWMRMDMRLYVRHCPFTVHSCSK